MNDQNNSTGINLRKYYTLFLETGMVIVLLLFIVAMKVDLNTNKHELNLTEVQEVTEIQEVIRTTHKQTPAAPPQPIAPVPVPDHEVIETAPLTGAIIIPQTYLPNRGVATIMKQFLEP